MSFPLPPPLQLMKRRGYAVFTQGDYNLNLVGLRNIEARAGQWDDFVLCAYKVGGIWQMHYYPATTDPSIKYLANPLNRAGCAIIKAGQYRSAYQVGLHKGKPGLCQVGPITVWRDNNRDEIHNHTPGSEAEGLFACNIHRASDSYDSAAIERPDSVGPWSAGCTVIPGPDRWAHFWRVITECSDRWGDRFTYTMLEGVLGIDTPTSAYSPL